MSWKTKKMPKEKKYQRDLIMHSIKGPAVAQIYPAMQQSNITHLPAMRQAGAWSLERMKAYLSAIAAEGFVVGAKVKTTYGRFGVIRAFTEKEAQTAYAINLPNCIHLTFADEPAVSRNPYLVFNTSELTLIGE